MTAEGVPAVAGSPLALTESRIAGGSVQSCGDPHADTLVYVFAGGGSLALGESTELRPGTAALVLAGEEAEIRATSDGIAIVQATVGPEADRHAPLGQRAIVSTLDPAAASSATGGRGFQVLVGPHNGSTRATLFLGFVPPGRAPWHYHLYDEIVWIPEGPGRLHIGDETEDLTAGSAFRLRPREVHIVENLGEREMAVLGVFTPAGSPSAAYLPSDLAAEHASTP